MKLVMPIFINLLLWLSLGASFNSRAETCAELLLTMDSAAQFQSIALLFKKEVREILPPEEASLRLRSLELLKLCRVGQCAELMDALDASDFLPKIRRMARSLRRLIVSNKKADNFSQSEIEASNSRLEKVLSEIEEIIRKEKLGYKTLLEIAEKYILAIDGRFTGPPGSNRLFAPSPVDKLFTLMENAREGFPRQIIIPVFQFELDRRGTDGLARFTGAWQLHVDYLGMLEPGQLHNYDGSRGMPGPRFSQHDIFHLQGFVEHMKRYEIFDLDYEAAMKYYLQKAQFFVDFNSFRKTQTEPTAFDLMNYFFREVHEKYYEMTPELMAKYHYTYGAIPPELDPFLEKQGYPNILKKQFEKEETGHIIKVYP